jgi:hypothetical protein
MYKYKVSPYIYNGGETLYRCMCLCIYVYVCVPVCVKSEFTKDSLRILKIQIKFVTLYKLEVIGIMSSVWYKLTKEIYSLWNRNIKYNDNGLNTNCICHCQVPYINITFSSQYKTVSFTPKDKIKTKKV